MNIIAKDPIGELYAERARLNPVMRGLQRFMTALPGQDDPYPRTGPVRHFLRDVFLLGAFGTAAGALGLASAAGGAAMLLFAPALLASLAAVGRLRKLTVGHKHENGHGAGFAGWRAAGADRRTIRTVRLALMHASAALPLATPAIQYMIEHADHHAMTKLGTVRDPDGAFLFARGFRRGLKKGEFRRRLLRLLFDPRWYLRETLRRLVETTTQKPFAGRAMAVAMWALIGGSVLLLPLPMWAFAIGFPWLIGYPAAALLQVITEHPYVDTVGARDLAAYAERTWDRIPWQRTPTGGGGATWVRWWTKFLLIHLPTRVAVYDRTMIWHRYHHLAWPLGRPFDAWWAIDHEVVKAWREGALPSGWGANMLEGLPAALRRQARFMESDR